MYFIASVLLFAALAKMVSDTFQFYKAAITYAVIVTILGALFTSKLSFAGLIIFGVIKLIIALPFFYLLDRYSDTIFTWLLIFGVGCVVMFFV